LEEIARNVYIEKKYPGVVLGVLKLNHGILMVDAPFQVNDQQSWRIKVSNLGGGIDKLLVMLDTQIDRVIGIHAMGTNVLAHQNSIEIMNKKPTITRGQDRRMGAEIELFALSASIEWIAPSLTYTDEVFIHWDNTSLLVSHKPGAHIAGSWLRYDSEKVIFVGDSVILSQPPFLAWSDLDRWLEELAYLQTDFFKDYKLISGREGVVSSGSINKLVEFLNRVKVEVKSLLLRENWRDGIPSAVFGLLKHFVFDPKLDTLFRKRLTWGLEQYIQNHYPVE